MKKLLLLIAISFCSQLSKAGYRGGEIIYTSLGGSSYGITYKTCTDTVADYSYLLFDFGDGSSDTLFRTAFIVDTSANAQQNSYYGTHVYPGPGTYTISLCTSYRNSGIANISNSHQVTFNVISTLT